MLFKNIIIKLTGPAGWMLFRYENMTRKKLIAENLFLKHHFPPNNVCCNTNLAKYKSPVAIDLLKIKSLWRRVDALG